MKIGLTLSLFVIALSIFSISCKDCKTCSITTQMYNDTFAMVPSYTSEEFCNTNLENVDGHSDSLTAFFEWTQDSTLYLKWYDCK
jgi:hypothetical protein